MTAIRSRKTAAAFMSVAMVRLLVGASIKVTFALLHADGIEILNKA